MADVLHLITHSLLYRNLFIYFLVECKMRKKWKRCSQEVSGREFNSTVKKFENEGLICKWKNSFYGKYLL